MSVFDTATFIQEARRILRDDALIGTLGLPVFPHGAVFPSTRPSASSDMCRVRSLILGHGFWVAGRVIGDGRHVRLANNLITTAYTVEYHGKSNQVETAEFYPRWGEIWWDCAAEPVITNGTAWVQECLYHRVVFVPAIAYLTLPQPIRTRALVPVWFPALLEPGDFEYHPHHAAEHRVRVFRVLGGVQSIVSAKLAMDVPRILSISSPHINALQIPVGSLLSAVPGKKAKDEVKYLDVPRMCLGMAGKDAQWPVDAALHLSEDLVWD